MLCALIVVTPIQVAPACTRVLWNNINRYFFELTTTPNLIGMDLAKFNLKAGAPVMILKGYR
jgi:hypothetical protein